MGTFRFPCSPQRGAASAEPPDPPRARSSQWLQKSRTLCKGGFGFQSCLAGLCAALKSKLSFMQVPALPQPTLAKIRRVTLRRAPHSLGTPVSNPGASPAQGKGSEPLAQGRGGELSAGPPHSQHAPAQRGDPVSPYHPRGMKGVAWGLGCPDALAGLQHCAAGLPCALQPQEGAGCEPEV